MFSRLDKINTQIVKTIRPEITKLVMGLVVNNKNIIEKKIDLIKT